MNMLLIKNQPFDLIHINLFKIHSYIKLNFYLLKKII